MRIGILTFHKSVNYGSVLQAWALQDLLKKKGHNVEIIDYEPTSCKRQYAVYLPADRIGNVIRNLFRIPVSAYRKQQIQKFEEFRKNELLLSGIKYNSSSSPCELEGVYDCVICGSDQIWNVNAKDCDDFFFLPGARIKKIAYGVSINSMDFTGERCNDDMREWIQNFDLISCREESGSARIREFINNSRQVHTVLDPSLIHEMKDYDSITGERILSGDYIFLYKVWSGRDSFRMASMLGRITGMPVYTMLLFKDILKLCKVERNGIRVLRRETGPRDYLSLIRHASFVMTDSFHGTAFSIIFERPFVSVRERRADGSEKNDERIRNLLNILEIRDRYLPLSEVMQFDQLRELDYDLVTAKRLKIAGGNIRLLENAIEA